ncbi:SNF2 family N-terminal domain-containing protein [Annulohypoxylon truncatum]|uniref:SNF2 family N-terminal domain-containing protein n=1 Tax=Annulohypoxylon truncatum TaxID=327061 RepID=UPI0020077B6B|nr:SNF2 family N-terminal domain-containing protein [Annulohypoxylon truncatum]KAI1213515.1 SNF2 family N-terminal domain-containing protein [Annulohypoxylon truncatum]
MTSDSGNPDDPKVESADVQRAVTPVTELLTNIVEEACATTAPAADSNAKDTIADIVDEEAAIKNLTANVRDQADVERDITYQANLALIDAEDKRDEKRIDKVRASIKKLKTEKKNLEEQCRRALGRPAYQRTTRDKIAQIDSDIKQANKDIADLQARIEQRHREGDNIDQFQSTNKKLPNESHRDFLIRTGKITPFANIGGPRPEGVEGPLADALIDAEDEAAAEQLEEQADYQPQSHQNLRAPGFDEEPDLASAAAESEFGLRPRQRQQKKRKLTHAASSSDEYVPQTSSDAPGADFVDQVSQDDERPRKKSKKATSGDKVDLSKIDDGNERSYQARLADWSKRRCANRRRKRQERRREGDDEADSGDEQEWLKPSPDHDDHLLQNGFKIPGDINHALFDYQRTGVQWLSELYAQKVGGIVGDEMGLGKTIQLIAFIATLHHSQQLDKPVIIVAPATVLKQWVNEFHRWWPPMRVSILHSSGSGMLSMKAEGRIEDREEMYDEDDQLDESKFGKAAKKIVNRVVKHGHVLVTTYAGLQTYGRLLTPVEWGYAVLDEGHKIRNPNSAVTIYCKELRTPNRIILSGTPMQNNLTELWSLFDFIFPMRLGTLVEFRSQFEIPIRLGGYANANNLQIMTGQKCAEVLKDAISPFLLQRLKIDVATDLPKKTEQVLFCHLTQEQRQQYESFLKSKEMEAIFKGSRNSLYGIDILRKICNHPDLVDPSLKEKRGYNWGEVSKSGKMVVVEALLQTWKKLGHKTLLFSQSVQMLNILESYVERLENIKYLRMDGETPIKERQNLVDKFNDDSEIDLFLLTTKVGGLGVNLTGANRVILYDPDWNPSTDVQARERAWRLGQKKEVTVYRLMTAGTIEEKIYHRQIFKQFLSSKVLKDPKQKTSFQLEDLHDLFTLGSSGEKETETSRLFKDSEVTYTGASAKANKQHPDPKAVKADGDQDVRAVGGVAGIEEYEHEESKEEKNLMRGLFSRAGVHSALEHDKIMNGNKPGTDPRLFQRDVAITEAEATASLERAAKKARSVPIGVVTWTGERGHAGGPSNIRRGRGGPSSAGVLAGLADRQGRNAPTNGSSVPPLVASNTNIGTKEFEKLIPEYVKAQGGRVPTKALVDHFNPFCVTKKQTEQFKIALNQVAQMQQRGSSMRGIWTVKKEYL